MNIKNLNIYSNDKLKNIRTKVIALSLVGTSFFTLDACINTPKKEAVNTNPSVVDIINCLSDDKDLTSTDEDMKKPIIKKDGSICNVSSLLKEYNKAIVNGDKNSANESLYYIGVTSLKSLIADICDLDFDYIKDIDVAVVKAQKVTGKNRDAYDYPIKFNYKDNNYVLFPQDKLARYFAYCVNKTSTNSLSFASDYCSIYDAYDVFKSSLLFDGRKEDLFVLNENNKDCYYGNVMIYYNYDKLDMYYDYFTVDADDITISNNSKTKVKC